MIIIVNDDGTREFQTQTFNFTAIKGMEGPMLYRFTGTPQVLHYCPKRGEHYRQDLDEFVHVNDIT